MEECRFVYFLVAPGQRGIWPDWVQPGAGESKAQDHRATGHRAWKLTPRIRLGVCKRNKALDTGRLTSPSRPQAPLFIGRLRQAGTDLVAGLWSELPRLLSSSSKHWISVTACFYGIHHPSPPTAKSKMSHADFKDRQFLAVIGDEVSTSSQGPLSMLIVSPGLRDRLAPSWYWCKSGQLPQARHGTSDGLIACHGRSRRAEELPRGR